MQFHAIPYRARVKTLIGCLAGWHACLMLHSNKNSAFIGFMQLKPCKYCHSVNAHRAIVISINLQCLQSILVSLFVATSVLLVFGHAILWCVVWNGFQAKLHWINRPIDGLVKNEANPSGIEREEKIALKFGYPLVETAMRKNWRG